MIESNKDKYTESNAGTVYIHYVADLHTHSANASPPILVDILQENLNTLPPVLVPTSEAKCISDIITDTDIKDAEFKDSLLIRSDDIQSPYFTFYNGRVPIPEFKLKKKWVFFGKKVERAKYFPNPISLFDNKRAGERNALYNYRTRIYYHDRKKVSSQLDDVHIDIYRASSLSNQLRFYSDGVKFTRAEVEVSEPHLIKDTLLGTHAIRIDRGSYSYETITFKLEEPSIKIGSNNYSLEGSDFINSHGDKISAEDYLQMVREAFSVAPLDVLPNTT